MPFNVLRRGGIGLTSLLEAVHALDSGKLYDAYDLYVAAGLYDPAHDIAVLELAPDAIIRQDLLLLRELFEVFEGRTVSNWNERGKVRYFLYPLQVVC